MESNVVLGRYTLLESRSITFVEISRMGLVDSLEIRQICVERFFFWLEFLKETLEKKLVQIFLLRSVDLVNGRISLHNARLANQLNDLFKH